MKKVLKYLMLSMVFSSCGGGKEDTAPPEVEKVEPTPIPNLVPSPNVSSRECPTGTVWTWDNLGEAYLLNYCTSCHSSALTAEERFGAPENTDFDTPALVQIWRSSMIVAVGGATAAAAVGDSNESAAPKTNTAGTMPPSLHVPAVENKNFIEWLNCGAPAGTDKIE